MDYAPCTERPTLAHAVDGVAPPSRQMSTFAQKLGSRPQGCVSSGQREAGIGLCGQRQSADVYMTIM